MRKIVLLFVVLMCFAFSGCGSNTHNVDYHGQKDLFKGAKDSYAVGSKVQLLYDLIATDTDYYFHVDGAEYSCSYDNKKCGYVIKFVMPDHDIEVYCNSENTMRRVLN